MHPDVGVWSSTNPHRNVGLFELNVEVTPKGKKTLLDGIQDNLDDLVTNKVSPFLRSVVATVIV